MNNKGLMRNPVARKKSGKTVDEAIPDLAYEISSQSLEEKSGGTTPVCASVMATALIASIATGIASAVTSNTQPWSPNKEGKMPKPANNKK